MRRTARVLSVAALAGAALGAAASAVSADAAGEVNPRTVGPGGTVTVSVACEATGGTPPASIDAHSQGFEQGTVQLQQVPGNDDQVTGPAYSGTAKIAPAWSFEGDQNATAPAAEWSADGTCPGQAGGQGKAWKATFTVTRDGTGSGTGTCGTDPHGDYQNGDHENGDFQDVSSCPTHTSAPTPAPVQRGVAAGQGGAFTDSVPALVAGGVLITGAAGAAVHRLRRRQKPVRG
ncbi:hypothetical protein ACKI1I_05265 [Streptomyces turgidiscabies]|uniref:LPXTG cell wall anchor domain protein n=1 Tax=Streptomyces turgidiscabies (strain Car8) TaxID=698760 RepID=L7FAD0_STRT8|nr:MULTISPECIES: hypothetical protein [Streptomyces]ELP68197.1 hypothetical protein STRTUCAR8_08870 [Streptomyces turgidiscabies Car8]MDX3491228.1 hypothetical protein [Streptomyces turgidiscabies]GAQ73081.1 hypothetical protein T45_04837 [Streptomyces turgidiscabies]